MKAGQYLKSVIDLLQGCDCAQLDAAVELIAEGVRNRRAIFVAGNGGSAATANHFAADFGKNVVKGNENRPRIMSLCCNMASVTAYANDEGYENAFLRQLTNWMEQGDILIVISASGNSPSVVKACHMAHQRGGKVIAMTGFSGGKLRELCDISLHANAAEYETVEDAHSVFCHLIVSLLKNRFQNTAPV